MLNNQMKLIKDLGREPTGTKGKTTKYGLFECSICKKHFKTIYYSAINGKTTKCKSCATSIRNTTHGLGKHRLYPTWNGIMKRIFNVNRIEYKHYGGRGITICDRWLDVKNFIEDMYPSYKEGLSIDRIDVNGNYEPSNCRWVTHEIQHRNTRLIMQTNKTGYRGVSLNKRDNKFLSQIKIKNNVIYLGYFKTALEAAIAYDTYVINNNLEHTINGVKFDSRN